MHCLINLIIYIILLVYIGLLLFINKLPNNIYSFIGNLISNNIVKLIIVVIIVLFGLEKSKKHNIGGCNGALLLALAYTLTIVIYRRNINSNENFNNDIKCNLPQNNRFNPQPYRPSDSTLESGIPDPLPSHISGTSTGPYSDSGIAYNFNMN